MSDHADRDWREILALAYLDAFDAGDAKMLAELWERAASDREIEDLLRELSEGLYELEGPGADFDEDADRVRAAALRHMPGYVPEDAPAGPITASDVARRLQADEDLARRLDPADRVANAALLDRDDPLPEPLRMSALADWGRNLGADAGPRYWSAFHKVAVMLHMARSQKEAYLAAARRADPKAGKEGGSP